MDGKCVLIILDGWGIGRKDFSNPIHQANLPTINYIKGRYASGALQASGIAVGLPWDEVGNSEVGHTTIGAGKILYQHYPRITLAIREGTFFKNPVFLKAFRHVKQYNSALNIAGLLTEGHVHASFEHLEALVKFAKREGVGKINFHLFADSKDSRPQSLIGLVKRLEDLISREGVGVLASLSGRNFGLDRDGHWDRTEQAYAAMTGTEPATESLELIAERNYNEGKNDDSLPPTVLGPQAHPIKDNDALIFLDYREDSIRQIAASFIVSDFDQFPVKHFKNFFVATMTEYSSKFEVPVAFPTEKINEPLGKVLSAAGKTQMLLAETEKYAHVTYFFNGFRDKPFPGQFPVLIPSDNVARHDAKPEMRAADIGSRIVEAVEEQSFDFVVANFANADIVAHTGNFDATITAVEAVDTQLKRIVTACEATDTPLLITADHGNAEAVADPITGIAQTRHDDNPVPFYAIGSRFARNRTMVEIARGEREVIGILSDVAPTVLAIMGISAPQEMTGKNLLRVLSG